ncbi:MAG: DUF5677 domain-containing protein [Nitrospirota bacterium]
MIESNKDYKKCEEALSSVLGLAFHFLETMRFNQKNPQQLISVCLYARLLELATACMALQEKKALVGIPVLLRSMFEADIDLTNLMKIPDYYKRMNASFLKEKLRVTKEAASSRPSPFLEAIRQNRDSKKDLREIQAELDRLTEEKNGPINIRCRAELAGKLDDYLTNYSMLCLDTHNNIRFLEEWHIEKLPAGKYRVVLFKQSTDDIALALLYVCHILLSQTKLLAAFLGTTGIEFDKYFRELQQLANAVTKNKPK